MPCQNGDIFSHLACTNPGQFKPYANYKPDQFRLFAMYFFVFNSHHFPSLTLIKSDHIPCKNHDIFNPFDM